jgi:hypothetical protein
MRNRLMQMELFEGRAPCGRLNPVPWFPSSRARFAARLRGGRRDCRLSHRDKLLQPIHLDLPLHVARVHRLRMTSLQTLHFPGVLRLQTRQLLAVDSPQPRAFLLR